MKTEYPFIYICSLLRSGSTLLQEMLTVKNECYILHEPGIQRLGFTNQDLIFPHLNEWGLDTSNLVDVKVNDIFEQILSVTKQVGVKEIRNGGWENFDKMFDDIRYVLIGRNPRDIYISCAKQLQRSDHWTPRVHPFNPAGLYAEVLPEILIQKEIVKNKPLFITVKYEELCTDTENIFKDLKWFIGADKDREMGVIGDFHNRLKRGKYENDVHESKTTNKMANRYKEETDEKLLEESETFYRLMEEYNEIWGYE